MSAKGRLLIIGPVPPPVTGEALAVKTLVEAHQLYNHFEVEILNRNNESITFFHALLRTIVLFIRYLYLLFAFRPDIVYLTLGQKIRGILRDIILIYVASLSGTKIVGHLHGGALRKRYHNAPQPLQRIMRLCYGKLSIGIVLGRSLINQLGDFIPPKRTRIIHNTYWNQSDLNAPLFTRCSLIERDHLRILFLSNVLPSKGLFDALGALPMLRSKGIPFQFVFAGNYISADGYSASALEKMVNDFVVQNDLANHVDILGFVTGEDKWRLLFSSDVFLLPTNYYEEGQPVSIIEAMHAGCAIISTSRAGIPDLVDEGLGGWFVPPKAPEMIAEKLEWIWNHPEWLEKASKYNIQKANMNFSIEGYISKILSVFAESLERNETNP